MKPSDDTRFPGKRQWDFFLCDLPRGWVGRNGDFATLETGLPGIQLD